MKNKLAFHAKKMKFVCILEAASVVLSVIWIISNVMSAEKKQIFSQSSIIITSSIFSFIPLILSVFILEYSKRGAKASSLIKIYAWISAFISATSIITIVYNYIKNDETTLPVESLIVYIISFVSWVLNAVLCERRKLFYISGMGVVLTRFYCVCDSVLSLIVFCKCFDIRNNFEVIKYTLYAILYGLAQECISVACAIILIFFVFSKIEDNLEEKLEKLNEDYTSGKITKDSYDIQRKNLLKKL